MSANKHYVFCHAWDLAKGNALYRTGPEHDAYGDGYEDGAAVAFGLMGMGEAIRDREAARPKRELDAWYERHLASQAAALRANQNAAAQQQAYNVGQPQVQVYPQRGLTIDEVIARDAWLQRERGKK